MVYQLEIIGIFFALVMIYLTFVQFKRKTIGKTSLYLWMLFWALGIVLIVVHPYINTILDPLNIIRVLDLYMILSFIFLFAVIFYLYIRVNKLNRRFENLARSITLKKFVDGK